jgi:hypothetical protein
MTIMAIRSATPGGTSAANPFPPAAAAVTAPAQASVALVPVKLPTGQIVSVSSQQDVAALQSFAQQTQAPIDLGRPAANSSAPASPANLLDIAADGFTAVGGFLAGSKYNRLLQDLQAARNNLIAAENALAQKAASQPEIINPILDALDAVSDYIEAGVSVLNAQITAVDMMAGGATAKVVGKFIGGGSDGILGGGGGMGTALALGGAGLGLGLLLSNNNSSASAPAPRRLR